MKFEITRARFLDGLKNAQNVVTAKGSLAVLQNVLIEAKNNKLTLTTTDLDLSIRTVVECDVKEEGATTLPAKILFNTISKVREGVVEVEVDENDSARIVAGSAKFKLSGLPEESFPKLPEEEESYEYTLPCQTLKEMLRKTAYAASQDDTRRTLKGVLMSFADQKITLVATDGRRLALVENELEFPVSEEREIILPSKAVQEIQRGIPSEGEVKIKSQNSQVCFSSENVKIYSKLIDDKYPNYRQVIPASHDIEIGIERQPMIEALERASVMTMDISTKLIFDSNKLTVTSAAGEIGSASDEVPIKYVGERIEIMFNPNFLMDCLRAIDDDEIRMEMNSGTTPAVIKCSIPFLYVLMPLRTN